MTFQFRPATRENVGLLIGLAGGTGSGKTYTGLRLASGITKALGHDRFAAIDTEAGRMKHYADQFTFDHGDLTAPFTPERYTEAIVAADEAGYPVILVDSASHVWAGDGGVLEMQEAEFQRMGAKDNVKMASWIKPKGSHKKMVSRLLQVRAHLILCFRAEEKIEMAKNPQTGKLEVTKKKSLTGLDGWIPVCEKTLPFELTVSFLLHASNPGVGIPIKLQEQHKALFPSGKLIDEECGARIAQWASGGTPRALSPVGEQVPAAPQGPDGVTVIAHLEAQAKLGMTQLLAAWGALSTQQRNENATEFGRIKRSVRKGAA